MAYNKTTWRSGDLISADKLNNAETGIEINDLASGLPRIDLTGDTTGMSGDTSKTLQFRFRDGKQDVSAYVDTKWQGDSSLDYPKKNLGFKFYKDQALTNKLSWKPKSSWKKDNAFNLKANWIDRTEARNLVNAKLQHEMFASQPIYFGNVDAWPRNIKSIESNKTITKIVANFISHSYGLQQLTISADVTLLEDSGNDANGNTLNLARIFVEQTHDTQMSPIVSFAGKNVGDTIHTKYTFTVTADAAGNRDLSAFDFVGGSDWEQYNSHVKFDNIKLTASADELPDPVPNVWDNFEAFQQAPAFGSIQGFPVEMYLNGIDQGLYTFNTKKNNNLLAMDKSNPNHLLVECGQNIDFNSSSYVLDGSQNYDSDFVTPNYSADANAKFNRLAKFVNESTDDDFKTNIAQYVDLYSVIDTMIFAQITQNVDGETKSILWGTYDGQRWFAIPYDFDSTWLMWWDGSRLDVIYNNGFLNGSNKLFNRVINLFSVEIQKRYMTLRKYVLSSGHITAKFKQFIDQIPQSIYDNNETIWPTIPSIDVTDYTQINGAIKQSINIADGAISNAYNYTQYISVDTSTQPQ